MPIGWIHVTHMGDSGAGEIESATVMGQQGLHHIGVVHGFLLQRINRCDHGRHRIKTQELGHHGVDHCGINEGLIPLNIDDRGLIRHHRSRPPGQVHQSISNRGDAFAA